MKWFALLGLLLFLGIAVAPSINADKTSSNQNIILKSTFIKGSKQNTFSLKLSEKEVDKLDILFKAIQSDFKQAESLEEAIDIVNKAIIELDKYGLLGDLTIQEAQHLITGLFQKPWMKVIERIVNNNPQKDQGIFTLVTAEACYSGSLAIIWRKNWVFHWIFPSYFGYFFRDYLGITYEYYAIGTVDCNGLNGIVNWSGDLKGALGVERRGFIESYDYFIGMEHFIGYVVKYSGNTHFLGFTPRIKLKNV